MDSLEKAHQYSSHHRTLLAQGLTCGCFNIFHFDEIKEWIDQNDTAFCPSCGIDTVVGECSGYPITQYFLGKMNKYWL